MTLDLMVSEICERLNLSSDDAKSRIGRNINNRYKRLTSSIGMATSRRSVIAATATPAVRTITFGGAEKLLAVIDRSDPKQDIVLEEVTVDEMHITPIRSGPPRHYAITNMHPKSVDIYVDVIPITAFTLYADALVNVVTLAGNQAPDFPESFHEILIFGAMADEYRKQEKVPLMEACEADYEKRLSDLRMWIAKSAYSDIYQGRYTGKSFRWARDAQILWDA